VDNLPRALQQQFTDSVVQLKHTRHFVIHKHDSFRGFDRHPSGTHGIEVGAITTPQIGMQRGFARA
jgi:hypothetical protein